MKRYLWALMPIFMILTACEEEQIAKVKSSIVITPVEQPSATGSVDPANNLINMGEVALYSGNTAKFKVTNPSQKTLMITEVKELKEEHVGSGEFGVVSFPNTVKNDVNNKQENYIVISYVPSVEWTDKNNNGVADDDELEKATFIVHSDAANGDVLLHVTGYGVYKGYPDFQVCFGAYCGPNDKLECYKGMDNQVECVTQPLDFGNIGLGGVGSQVITLKNNADCPRPEGTEICNLPDLCKVVINRNSTRNNIGFGFAPGTNQMGLFEIKGSVSLPAEFVQPAYTANQCNSSVISEIKVRINYNAPTINSEDETTLVIESNDPLNPVVKIPIKGSAKNAPVARCRFRQQDPDDPTAPYTDDNHIAPLQKVYLDGSYSSDPQNESAFRHGIKDYEWEIISYPDGTNPLDFQPSQIDTFYDFTVPLAGHYEVRLKVTNTQDTVSGNTPESICSFDVKPASKLHIQLVWDDPGNDQDLHLVYLDKSHLLCSGGGADCYWPTEWRQPVWFSDFAAGVGPNPRLDIDKQHGKGPENINIDDPKPGTYRIYVHYYQNGSAPTKNTVRVFLNGLQSGEYYRIMNLNQIWAVADIIWKDDGNGELVTLTSDNNEDSGWICDDFHCSMENPVCELQ